MQRRQGRDRSATAHGNPLPPLVDDGDRDALTDRELYKCKLQPVDAAIDRGVYGSWRPSASETARLKEIFPTGVCDFSKRDQGRPPGFG